MACSICGKEEHNKTTCPHNGDNRTRLPGKRSKKCQCCGRYGQDVERHHTTGVARHKYLDLCTTCHLRCGHQGKFQNLPIKPEVCRVTGNDAFWRG